LRGSEASAKKEEEVFVIETEGYINCVSALLKLIEVNTLVLFLPAVLGNPYDCISCTI